MTKIELPEVDRRLFLRVCSLILIFIIMTAGIFLYLRKGYMKEFEDAGIEYTDEDFNRQQMKLYTVGGSLLLAAVGTLWAKACMSGGSTRQRRVWEIPLAAAGLSLVLMSLAYINLGVYPVGEKSILIVDMHHQYAPLLSELRHMFIEGGNFTYSFHIGLGANFISCFAYYLSSPLNLLLVFFSETQLTDAILFITLLKNALCAAAFAACVQYIYRKRNAAMVAVSVMYSMALYMLAYSWNIMWLDVVILLPVVVMCFERMMREGKWLGYVLTLALALFCNYYIGFMLCMFLVLYFVTWQMRAPRTLKARATATCRFGIGSLLGGGLAMALILPTYLALSRTSAAGDTLPDFNSTFEIFELVGRLYYGATPTIRSGNLPNIYCSVAAVLLVPIYATQRTIPLRRRLSFVALLTVLLFSCTINRWDLLWHGLHSPNDLPYRFSFLVSFVMLLMVAHVLTHLAEIKPKQILGSMAASVAFLVIWEKFDSKHVPEDKLLYVNILLLALYAVILLVSACRKMPIKAGRVLLLLLVTFELLVGSVRTMDKLDGNEYFTLRKNYVANDATQADAEAVKRAQEIAEKAGDKFARIEYLPRNTCVDPALHHYKGLTTFASSNPHTTTLFMGDIGYAINGVNSYLYHSFVAPSDSLLGLKYIILDFKLSNNAHLKFLESVTYKGETRYIYENTTALPVGYFADNDIRQYKGKDYSPFYNQEALYERITGYAQDIYRPLTMEPFSEGSTYNDGYFIKTGSESTEYFTGIVTTETAGQYFAFVDCRAADSIHVSVINTDGQEKNSWSVTTHEPYVIDLGKLVDSEQVQVSISSDGSVSGNIHVVRLHEEAFAKAVDAVRKYGFNVTESSATSLKGTVTAPEAGTVMFSIPYDKGWVVTVDGKPAKTVPIDKAEVEETDEKDKDEGFFGIKKSEEEDGALLAVEVGAGKHEIVLQYRAPGQSTGLILSIISAAALGLLWWADRLYHRRKALALENGEPWGFAAWFARLTEKLAQADKRRVEQNKKR